MQSPRRGEADPNALDRLALALEAPQLVAPRAAPPTPVEFDVRLEAKDGKVTHVVTHQAPLGAPVPVSIDGVGDFLVSPVEFSTQLPDPADFLPTGLWVTAGPTVTSLQVKGAASYRLVGGPSDWKSADGKASRLDFDDFPGVIVGRMVIGFPTEAPAALGLAPPAAVATLCAGAQCRDFQVGRVVEGPRTRYFAQAPDADPVELRASDGRKLLEGPWPRAK